MVKNSKRKKCLISGQELTKDSGLKFTLSPEREICIDLEWKLPGKSIYMVTDQNVLREAISNQLFETEFQLKIDEKNIWKQLGYCYRQKLLTYIALAKKSGKLIMGKFKIENYLKTSFFEEVLILQAYDTSEREKFKSRTEVPVLEIYNSNELSAVCGHPNIHFILIQAEFTKIILQLANNLKNFTKETDDR